jgi:hypothetical protein
VWREKCGGRSVEVRSEEWREGYLAGGRMRECYSSPGDTSPHPILEPHQMDDVIKDVFLSNHHQ